MKSYLIYLAGLLALFLITGDRGDAAWDASQKVRPTFAPSPAIQDAVRMTALDSSAMARGDSISVTMQLAG